MESPTPLPPPPAPLPSRRSAQAALAAFLVVLLGLIAARGYGTRYGARPTDLAAQTPSLRLDLNRADPTELEQVPGVGPTLARAIADHRRDRGRFESVEGLRAVHGVGPATFDKLRPYLFTVSPPPGEPPADVEPLTLSRKPAAPPPAAPPPAAPPAWAANAVAKLSPGQTLDVNAASAEDLQRLPGIGPTLAARVTEARGRERFKTVDDLRRVKGIGPKTLEGLRPYVVVR